MLRHLPKDARETGSRSSAERWQRAGAVAAVVAAASLLLWRCTSAPDVAFLAGSGWITNPRIVDARVQQWGQEQTPLARFSRRFDLASVPQSARLQIEAVRTQRVLVNGVAVAEHAPDPAWRRGHEIDVAKALRVGENELAIEVSNRRGPPLLRVRVEEGPPVATGAGWEVAIDGGVPEPAVTPDDTRLHPSRAAGPTPRNGLREHGALVVGLFGLALLFFAQGEGWLAAQQRRLPLLALAMVHALWIALFATKLAELPLEVGFDANNHLFYVDLLLEHHALPRPDAGWSTYHPPLYYVLVALFRSAFGSVGAKLPSFAAGLGLVWVTFALARLLLARPEAVATAVLFAGLLPLTGYTAAYVSNEPLHAALFGLATWLVARALAAPRLQLVDVALAAAAIGAALLAKVTAALLLVVAGFFVMARQVQLEGVALGRLFAVAASYAVPPLAIAGWFYVRNGIEHGQLVVGNWNIPGKDWWSQPGFHTASYYAGFGESLRRPVLSGFHSFGDAMYASFWGDGWIAGRASAAFPTEAWSWGFVALGYWLALPATFVLAIGLVRMAQRAFDPAEHGRRAAWSFLLAVTGAVATALVALTLDLPFFGQAKAPYLLCLVPIFAVAFALGVGWLDRALDRRFGTIAARLARAFWVATGAVLWLSLAA